MSVQNDPIGKAILDYVKGEHDENIIVRSELCDDDIIPVSYLFRSYKQFPNIEKEALKRCSGSVLDVGAAAGVHAKELIKNGFTIKAIDRSPGSIQYLKSLNVDAVEVDFFSLKNEKFDTLLILMNGIGIVGELNNLPSFLKHCRSLLNDGGKIICDTTDIKYLFENEDGSMWIDLASEYYGNFSYQMIYKDQVTEWFDWLYLDRDTFKSQAEKEGFHFEIVAEEEDHYLVELSI